MRRTAFAVFALAVLLLLPAAPSRAQLTTPCSKNEDCATSQACFSGTCQVAKICSSNTDCDAGQSCVTDARASSVDKVCEASGSSKCPDTTTNCPCNGDADCSSAKKCQIVTSVSTVQPVCAPPGSGTPMSGAGPAGGASQGSGDSGPVKLINPLKATSVPELISNILKAGIGLVGALALLMFIYGGLRWLTSAGEPAKIQAGQNAMKWAAIGLVVIFSSYTLVSFVLGSIKG